MHDCLFEKDRLLRNLPRIQHLPAVIVQGRYDLVCPAVTVRKLKEAWPGAVLKLIPDAGRSAFEPGITRELVVATNRFRDEWRFS